MSAYQGKLKDIPEQAAWLSEQMAKTPVCENPCVRIFGAGPADVTCKTCSHLYCNVKGHRFYKCDLRKHTNGPASDHKVKWPACAKYSKR